MIGLLSHLVFPTPIGSNYSHTHFADEEMEPQEAMEFSQTHPIIPAIFAVFYLAAYHKIYQLTDNHHIFYYMHNGIF